MWLGRQPPRAKLGVQLKPINVSNASWFGGQGVPIVIILLLLLLLNIIIVIFLIIHVPYFPSRTL